MKNEILRSVVIHYISDATPIGSAQLQKDYALNVSSATIRNYFQRLVVDGMLEQLHSSSGRIPTQDALIAFWIQELSRYQQHVLPIRSRELLGQVARHFGLYVMLHSDRPDHLQEIGLAGRHLVLHFEKGAVLVPHNKAVERFLGEFKGLDMHDLIKVAAQMGITEVVRSLQEFVRVHSFERFNPQALIELADRHPAWGETHFDDYYNGRAVYRLRQSVVADASVPSGCIAGKQYCRLDGQDYTLTYLGEASRDFRKFLTLIQGGSSL